MNLKLFFSEILARLMQGITTETRTLDFPMVTVMDSGTLVFVMQEMATAIRILVCTETLVDKKPLIKICPALP